MRRGLAKFTPPPTSAAFSTFSGSGGFGRGRGRGPSPPVSGEDSSVASNDDPFVSDYGRGRGRGRGDGPHPSSPLLPSFSLFASSSQGRGRGSGITSPDADAPPKKPFFFSRERDDRDPVQPPKPTSDIDSDNPLSRKPDMSSFVSALGRGKPTTPTEPSPKEQSDRKQQQQMSMSNREDATRRAMEVLSRAGAGSESGRGMRGRGGSGRGMRGRGRGRGRGRESSGQYDDMDFEDGEVGDDEVELDEYFEQAASVALPSPLEDAYQEAVHTNNMVPALLPPLELQSNKHKIQLK